MKIHQLTAAEALATLHTSMHGLTSIEAARRLQTYGPNQVAEVQRRPPLAAFLRELTPFFSIVLWLAAALSFLAAWSAPGQGMARLGGAIVAVIVVSGVFSFWQEYRARQALAALQRLLPTGVAVVRDGSVTQLPAAELVPGDVVLLEAGDRIPADGRLIEAFAVRVNTATVTGESVAQPRDAAPSDSDDLLRSTNIVLAGTSLVSGRAKAVVFATGMRTEFGRIAQLTQVGRAAVSPLQRQIAHLSRAIVGLALTIGGVFFLLGWLIDIPFWEDLIFAIGLIVAMVPEGLQPTLTLALVLATQRMAKRQVLIRHLASVEALGSTTVICTDKTGTLTQNRMTVKALFLGKAVALEAHAGPADSLVAAYRPLFLAALLCHDVQASDHGGVTTYVGDPMEVALVHLAEQVLPAATPPRRVHEIPFDTERMRLSTVYELPEGRTLFCKGAPETVLPLCEQIWVDGEARPLTADWCRRILGAQEEMAGRGLRVLAFAYRVLGDGAAPTEQGLIFTGLAGLEDPPRPEVSAAVRTCREAGIKVIMVTGDHPRTATAIAREVGLVRAHAPVVLTGDEVRRLSGPHLQRALDAPEVIVARVAADQKLRIVEALKQQGHIVAVTGDGVNDAPALKSAHIGIAMGRSGTDVAKEAADMVLLDDHFASIVNAIEEGRAVFDNIRKFLTYILAHNVPELVPYLGFALFKIPLALTPLQILAIDMGTDSLTALGLGVERPDPQVMQRPPRAPQERLFNRPLALRAYLFLGLLEAVAAMAAFFFVLTRGGWFYGQALGATDPLYQRATTACLSAIIAMQIANVFLCRSATRSVLATGMRGNHWILWGVALEVALAGLIAYTPWGQAILGTASLQGEVWLFMLPFVAAMVLGEELRKWAAKPRR
jgi:sodium/potassium-transporting ATPase subunit alpha